MFTLCPVILLSSFISSGKFFGGLREMFYTDNHGSSTIQTALFLPHKCVWLYIFLFFPLIALEHSVPDWTRGVSTGILASFPVLYICEILHSYKSHLWRVFLNRGKNHYMLITYTHTFYIYTHTHILIYILCIYIYTHMHIHT